MIGQYQHNIDAKGRLFIPAKYREELGETFYVTLGLDGCLSVYSDAKWAELTAKFDALPLSKARSMRTLFANAAKCEPDSQGRILIPAKLRQYAALEREVVINGASKCVELWNPERWAPIESAGLDPENLAAAMEELRRTTDISRCCWRRASGRWTSGLGEPTWTAPWAGRDTLWRSCAGWRGAA